MFKTFRWRLTGSYLLLILVLLILAGGLVFSSFKNYYLHNLEQRLTREAYIIADMARYFGPDQSESYQDLCIRTSHDNAARVTVIDQNGVVLGDSESDYRRMENHKSRPEVYKALHGVVGVAMRYSKTEKIKMLYVAVPLNNQTQSGVVRIALPLSELKEIYKKIMVTMLFALLLAALLASIISLFMAKKFSGPLDEITNVVQDMASGNLKRRICYQSSDEVGILAHAFNEMADHVENGIAEISNIKNRLEALLKNSVNGIFMADAEGRISYANPVALSLLGIKESMIGRSKNEIISNFEILESIDQVKNESASVRKEVVLHTHGGKTVETNVVPILGENGEMQGILVVLNDISELKRLEQVRKDFVANVSHELKTPVATISGFAETLLDEKGENLETVQEFSRIIFDEAQRLNQLINGLLELSRIEAEQGELHIVPTNIVEVLQSTIDIIKRQKDHKNINLQCIPQNSQPVFSSDPVLITHVLNNLLDNAVKYSSPEAEITIILKDLEDQIIVRVQDRGIGIPQQDLTRIFERFYRVDKARSRKTGGSGLGLAIVKHLVEKLGGQITVESKLGEGSIFSVFLPKR